MCKKTCLHWRACCRDCREADDVAEVDGDALEALGGGGAALLEAVGNRPGNDEISRILKK